MTVAAGLMCSDGMVLCADSEETISEERKGSISKIRFIRSYFDRPVEDVFDKSAKPDWSVGISGAGWSDWVLKFVQGLDDAVLDKTETKLVSLSGFKGRLEEYNQDFFERYVKGYADDPTSRPQVQMIIVVQSGSMEPVREIYRTNDNLVLGTSSSICVTVGKGAPVFQSLADRLLTGSCTTAQAASIAIYIMEKVKAEVPGCGGNSHILMVGANGRERLIPTRRVRELEMHHLDVEMRFNESLAVELIKELP